MTWVAFYIDQSGEGLHESYDDWATARDVLRGLIDMVRPTDSLATFHRELDHARPEREFHVTDGIYQFALETIN